MSVQKAPHRRRPRGWTDFRKQRKPAVWSRLLGPGPAPLLGPQPASRWPASPTPAGSALAEPGSPHPSGGRSACLPGCLMGSPAEFRGVVPGLANVRSPRPPAAGAPASTPGSDRYASGGGQPGAPSPPWAPLTVVPGPPALRVGAGWILGGATPRDTAGPAPAWFFSASPRSPLIPFNLTLFWLRVPFLPPSVPVASVYIPLSLSGCWGGLLRCPKVAWQPVPRRPSSSSNPLAPASLGVADGCFRDKDKASGTIVEGE